MESSESMFIDQAKVFQWEMSRQEVVKKGCGTPAGTFSSQHSGQALKEVPERVLVNSRFRRVWNEKQVQIRNL